MKNKYGVPYHKYEITLANGDVKYVDVAVEEEWGNIDRIYRDAGFGNMVECVGYGNENDGHIEIIGVVDCESDRHYSPLEWADKCVWIYIDNYCD